MAMDERREAAEDRAGASDGTDHDGAIVVAERINPN